MAEETFVGEVLKWTFTKIVRLPFDKMQSKSTIELPTRKPPKTTAKKGRKLEVCQDACVRD